MATYNDILQLINDLPSGERLSIFTDLNRELQRFSTWAAKTTAFREEIGDPQPGDPSFRDALQQWEAKKADMVLNRMADQIMVAFDKKYGERTVEKADVINFLHIRYTTSKLM